MDDRPVTRLSYVDALGATNYNSASHEGNDENKQFGDDSVKPIFIQESDLFGTTKPNRDQFLTHVELYKQIGLHIDASHIKGIQRVRGLWRIYLDNMDDRNSLAEGIVIRNKRVRTYDRNPRVVVHEHPSYIRIRVKNVPLSADDGQILRMLEALGCHINNNYRERLRVDSMLTNCQTGDRIVISSPLETPLPRNILIGKYRATIIHRGQILPNQELKCNKCLQMGHKQSACMNDWCCTTCGKDGHKRNECTSSLSSDSDQSDSSDDESCSVDNGDAQTDSNVQESTQSTSVDESTKSSSQQVDEVKEGDVAPPTTSNSKPENNDIKETTPQHGVKTPKKAGSRKKRKAVRQKDNSEGTQPQISSFFGGQDDISNTPKNSRMEKVKKTSNIQRTPPTPPDIVHDRQNEKKKSRSDGSECKN